MEERHTIKPTPAYTLFRRLLRAVRRLPYNSTGDVAKRMRITVSWIDWIGRTRSPLFHRPSLQAIQGVALSQSNRGTNGKGQKKPAHKRHNKPAEDKRAGRGLF